MFKVNNSLLVSQNPDITEITLVTDNGMNIIRPRAQGNHINKSDDELIELGLREFYKEHFADKFQNESIEKLDRVTGVTNSAVVELTQMFFTLSTRLTALESANNEVSSDEDDTSEA